MTPQSQLNDVLRRIAEAERRRDAIVGQLGSLREELENNAKELNALYTEYNAATNSLKEYLVANPDPEPLP